MENDSFGISFKYLKYIWSASFETQLTFSAFATLLMMLSSWYVEKVVGWVLFGRGDNRNTGNNNNGYGNGMWQWTISLIVFLIGLVGWTFRKWSKIVLGNKFTYMISDPGGSGSLISEGPYKYLVHPGYAGGLLHIVTIFILASVYCDKRFRLHFFILWVALAASGLVVRICDENDTLQGIFQNEWEDHIKGKYFLIPFIL